MFLVWLQTCGEGGLARLAQKQGVAPHQAFVAQLTLWFHPPPASVMSGWGAGTQATHPG